MPGQIAAADDDPPAQIGMEPGREGGDGHGSDGIAQMELVSTTGPEGAWAVGSRSTLTLTLLASLVGERGMGMAT